MRSLTPEGSVTTLKVDFDPDSIMTGREKFPVIGSLLTSKSMNDVCEYNFGGLQTYADCVKKNIIGRKAIEKEIPTVIAAGAIRLVDKHKRGMYGFDFNPPFELHAWLIPIQYPRAVIDFSLPGIIQRALKFTDDLGPIFGGYAPCYLAGPLPKWIIFKPVEIHEEDSFLASRC